jgi:hypothetical protein
MCEDAYLESQYEDRTHLEDGPAICLVRMIWQTITRWKPTTTETNKKLLRQP